MCSILKLKNIKLLLYAKRYAQYSVYTISSNVMITLRVGHSHCLYTTEDEMKLGEVKGLTQGRKVSTGQG